MVTQTIEVIPLRTYQCYRVVRNRLTQYHTRLLNKKLKEGHTPMERRRGAHFSYIGRSVRRWTTTIVCDAWPVRRQSFVRPVHLFITEN